MARHREPRDPTCCWPSLHGWLVRSASASGGGSEQGCAGARRGRATWTTAGQRRTPESAAARRFRPLVAGRGEAARHLGPHTATAPEPSGRNADGSCRRVATDHRVRAGRVIAANRSDSAALVGRSELPDCKRGPVWPRRDVFAAPHPARWSPRSLSCSAPWRSPLFRRASLLVASHHPAYGALHVAGDVAFISSDGAGKLFAENRGDD